MKLNLASLQTHYHHSQATPPTGLACLFSIKYEFNKSCSKLVKGKRNVSIGRGRRSSTDIITHWWLWETCIAPQVLCVSLLLSWGCLFPVHPSIDVFETLGSSPSPIILSTALEFTSWGTQAETQRDALVRNWDNTCEARVTANGGFSSSQLTKCHKSEN